MRVVSFTTREEPRHSMYRRLAVSQSKKNKISCLCRDSNSGSSKLSVLLHRKSCCCERGTAYLTVEMPTRWRCDWERLLMT